MITPAEILKIITFIGISYPNYPVFADKESAKNTARVWADMLGDIGLELLEMAVKKHTATNKWPPTIAEIRESALKIVQPEQEHTAAEAWGEVIKAIGKYGLNRYKEALDSMKPATRKVTECVGFRTICMVEEDEIGVVRGQFLKMYSQIADRQKQDALLPEGLKDKIHALAEAKKFSETGCSCISQKMGNQERFQC